MPKSSKGKSAARKPPKSKKSVASALPKAARKKGRGPMNDKLVKEYATQLSAALGSSPFEELFARLKDDPAVRQDEAVAITSLLLEAQVAPSTGRGAALGRILKLHNSLTTFKLKQRAVGGRSAA
jgi:hypothetical protein